MKIKVSELIVQYLEKLEIKTIYGIPGAHILPVYDALYDSNIQSVLVKHEQGAAFMASGDAKVTGKIAACIATAGPGATNLITGIANAYVDKQAVIAITGEAPTHIFGKGGLQESSGEGGSIDQSALFKAVSGYHKIIERTDYLPHILNQASRILLSDNPTPVILSIPFNVQQELIDNRFLENIKTSNINCNHKSSINFFAKMVSEAEHPIIVAGYGAIKAQAQSQLSEFAQTLNIPVTTSLKAKGIIDEESPLSLGSLGVTSGGYAYQYMVDKADLVIFLGAGFNERTSYVWKDTLLADKKIIQIDINPAQLNKVFQSDLAIQGSISAILIELNFAFKKRPIKAKSLVDLAEYKDDLAKKADATGQAIFDSKFAVVKTFFKQLPKQFKEPICVFDDNIILAQNFYQVPANHRYYPNTGISSLGQAIPAAIGAGFVLKNQPLFAIIGDGGFQMCCMELMTAVNYNISLNVILINNASMGLIRKNQYQQYQERYINCDFINPDYQLLAKSFNINYFHIENAQDIQSLFQDCNFTNQINLIEIILDRDAFPNYRSNR